MSAEAKLTAEQIRDEIIAAARAAVARAAAAQRAAAPVLSEQVPANDALTPVLPATVVARTARVEVPTLIPHVQAYVAPAVAPVVAPLPVTARSAPAIAPAKVAPVSKPKKPDAKRVQSLSWPMIWTAVTAAILIWGYHAHLERYVSPKSGTGYWLGIVGGSLMILLLLYSARKRVSWLRWMGGIPSWFEFHMVLGVVGPILILFHANFSLGATNSNVALISMLLVAGSGVVGRYIYTRLHAHLDGNEGTLDEMRAVGERLREQTTSIEFLPGLLDGIDAIERRWIVPPKNYFGRLVHLVTGALRIARARYLVRREIRNAVAKAIRRESPLVAKHAERIAEVARGYAYRRLDAGRRVAEYKMYAGLFSLWHVLHIPLFFMLLIAGIVHVIAVNVY